MLNLNTKHVNRPWNTGYFGLFYELKIAEKYKNFSYQYQLLSDRDTRQCNER